MTYIDFLTPGERMCAIRIGAIRKLASMGISPSGFSKMMEKSAQSVGSPWQTLSLKGLLTLAVGLGIPAGALTYALKSAIAPNKRQNRDLKARLDEYNDIVDEYKNMSQEGAE